MYCFRARFLGGLWRGLFTYEADFHDVWWVDVGVAELLYSGDQTGQGSSHIRRTGRTDHLPGTGSLID